MQKKTKKTYKNGLDYYQQWRWGCYPHPNFECLTYSQIKEAEHDSATHLLRIKIAKKKCPSI